MELTDDPKKGQEWGVHSVASVDFWAVPISVPFFD